MASRKKAAGAEARPAGLTRQREVVLRIIQESGRHPTAAEIFDQARQRMPRISYATVYNSLHYLKTAKLIREITFGNAASRYDGNNRRHDHAICSRCGKLVDFDLGRAAELMRRAARSTRFAPETVHLTLVGLCPECRAESPTA